MARVTKNVLGTFSGKMGNVVGVVIRGRQYLRALPKKNKKRLLSVGQKGQINKFKVLSPFLNQVSDFLKVGFSYRGFTNNQSANSMARAANLRSGVKGVFPDQKLNWEGILISDGELAVPGNVVVTSVNEGFNFHWDEQFDENNGSEFDRTMILLYIEKRKRFYYSFSGACRKELNDVYPLLAVHAGMVFRVFIAFKNILTTEVSRSVYCGEYTFNPAVVK